MHDMVQDLQTSFIPKRSSTPQARSKAGVGLLTVIAIILLVLAIGSGVAVFVYKGIIHSGNEKKDAQLKDIHQQFNAAILDEVGRLDERIKGANELLDGHIAMTGVFPLIEEVTLQSVQFASFNLATIKEECTPPTLDLSGLAEDFNAVAVQSKNLGEHGAFITPIVTGHTVTETGRVRFGVTTGVDPKYVDFRIEGLGEIDEVIVDDTDDTEDETETEDDTDTTDDDVGDDGEEVLDNEEQE